MQPEKAETRYVTLSGIAIVRRLVQFSKVLSRQTIPSFMEAFFNDVQPEKEDRALRAEEGTAPLTRERQPKKASSIYSTFVPPATVLREVQPLKAPFMLVTPFPMNTYSRLSQETKA